MACSWAPQFVGCVRKENQTNPVSDNQIVSSSVLLKKYHWDFPRNSGFSYSFSELSSLPMTLWFAFPSSWRGSKGVFPVLCGAPSRGTEGVLWDLWHPDLPQLSPGRAQGAQVPPCSAGLPSLHPWLQLQAALSLKATANSAQLSHPRVIYHTAPLFTPEHGKPGAENFPFSHRFRHLDEALQNQRIILENVITKVEEKKSGIQVSAKQIEDR